MLNKHGKAILVECPVVKSEYKGVPSHKYRTHEIIQVKSIPTLIDWNNPSKRLIEAECYDQNKLNEFFGFS